MYDLTEMIKSAILDGIASNKAVFFNNLTVMHPSSSGEDTALSRQEHGFESRWVYHIEIHSLVF